MCTKMEEGPIIQGPIPNETATPKELNNLKQLNNNNNNNNNMKLTLMKKTETNDLQYQVAGHSRVGLLTHKKHGYVLKPVQKEPLGSREIEFYQRVFESSAKNCQDKDHLKWYSLFRNVVPKFYGVVVLVDDDQGDPPPSDSSGFTEPNNQQQQKYLLLDNIVNGFKKTSVIDLKIGAQTWDPDASITKINTEKSKYTGTKPQLGISITGMLYYNATNQQSIRCKDGFGKLLTTDTISEVLKQFLNCNYENGFYTKLILNCILDKLQIIRGIFAEQTLYNFYSSSILISYDFDYVFRRFNNRANIVLKCEGEDGEIDVNRTNSVLKCDQEINVIVDMLRKDEVNNWLHVWMIDFAHVHLKEQQKMENCSSSKVNELDKNYIFGLDNLILILNNLLLNCGN